MIPPIIRGPDKGITRSNRGPKQPLGRSPLSLIDDNWSTDQSIRTTTFIHEMPPPHAPPQQISHGAQNTGTHWTTRYHPARTTYLTTHIDDGRPRTHIQAAHMGATPRPTDEGMTERGIRTQFVDIVRWYSRRIVGRGSGGGGERVDPSEVRW